MTWWSYRVYVIQLRVGYGLRDHKHLPALYVGSTYYTAEERLLQHRNGYKTGSRYAGPHVWRLRPELYEDLPVVYDRDLAERLERERALRLAEAGFTVRSDGVIPRVPPSRLRAFTAAELAGVEDVFDRAVFSVVARCTRPLQPAEVTTVLMRLPGESPSALVKTPCEDIGRFAHVEIAAVQERLAGIMKRGWLETDSAGALVLPALRQPIEHA